MAEHVKNQPSLHRKAPARKKSRLIFLFLLFIFFLFVRGRATGQDKAPLSDQLVGGTFSYITRKGDSLTSIGARFGVTVRVLATNNHLSPSSILKTGQALLLDNRHIVPNGMSDGIVINIPQRMLFYFKERRLIHAFPVGLGRHDWPTPTGAFRIVSKEENPNWDVPISIQNEMRREGKAVKTCVPPGPDNPLGKHWLGLSIAGYGIHGTIAPTSIYRFQTHGCIRAHPDDIATLFDDVSRGTPGILVYHRLMIASVGGRIYLEVHRDAYNKETDVRSQLEDGLKTLGSQFQVDRFLATSIIQQQDGIAREIGVKKSR